MIFYFASSTYQQVISSAIKETDKILEGQECGSDIYFAKYVRENYQRLLSIETLVIDISALADTDEEILDGLDSLKIGNYDLQIIILAANRYVGDALLTKCFQMGIYDLIVTDDFLEISQELKECIRVGKKYGDALQFRDLKPENVIVKEEVKQTVNKVVIGMAGTVPRIGVTHHAIILANWLRKKGYMVALIEKHPSSAFEQLREFYDERMFEDFYTMGGVDFYPYQKSKDTFANVLGKSYNFIIADFGLYEKAELYLYNKSDVRIILSGSKPWELEGTQKVFDLAPEEIVKEYNFYFNFTASEYENDLKEGMGDLEKIGFLKYTENPVRSFDFPGAEKMLADYMPLKVQEPKRKGIFKNEKKKKKQSANFI